MTQKERASIVGTWLWHLNGTRTGAGEGRGYYMGQEGGYDKCSLAVGGAGLLDVTLFVFVLDQVFVLPFLGWLETRP